jgi:hypothetical protein
VTNLWMEALDNFSPVMWTNSVRHCEDLISGDWRREMGTYTLENIPPIIITLADSEVDFKLTCNLYCHGNGTKLQI